ncbi:MAG: AAA family ATPase [Candidatus Aenigmarchaeota archaeon]|nr:AAA family ATPase [Candidatus Aenigmarchaeota archaeon]
MLQKLELESFRSHKKSELRFDTGTNVLIGISGSGKSSVLDAICFALYGNTPKIQSRKLKVSDLIMDKPTKEDEAKLKLTFQADGKDYEVTRVLSREKPTYAELRENSTLKATGTTQVTEAVERILKTNFDLFSKIIYSEQNQMDYFLTVPKGDRMSKIDELLKLERFEKARHIAVSFAGKLKFKAKNLQEASEKFNEEELSKDKAALQADLAGLETRTKELSAKKTDLDKTLEILTKLLQDMEAKKREIEKLRAQKQENDGAIRVIESELKELPEGDLEKERERFENARQEFNEKSQKEEARKKEVAGIESELREKRSQLEKKSAAEEFLKGFDSREYELLEAKLKELEIGHVREEHLEKELSTSIRSLNSAGQKCPTCDTPLSDEKRIILLKEKRDALMKTQERLSNLVKEIIAAQKEAQAEKENTRKAEEKRAIVNDIGNVAEKIDTLQKQLNKLEAAKIDLDAIRKTFEEKRQLKELLERKTAKLVNLCKYREALQKVEGQLSGIEFNEEVFEKLKVELEEKRRARFGVEKDLQYSQEIQREKSKALVRLLESIDFLLRNRSEIEQLKYSTETLDKFSEVLSEVQGKLREEFVLTLNEVMNEVWSELYPYEDYSAIRFKIEDNDYTLQLCDLKSNWVNVEGISSGGERAIASFVMRVALSIILAPNLKLLILDEPTHNLDAETIENLTEILRTKMTDLIDQIFIVTHDERLAQAATAYTYELRRESKKKEPTEIHRIETFLSS